MAKPVMLVILDGFGYRKESFGNAIAQAKMPFWRYLVTHHRATLLNASGASVGLPEGYMGNSEVGHLTIGAGRVVPSPLKRFDDAVSSGSLATSPVLMNAFKEIAQTGASLHLMGLLSDAGVHSHERHLYALLIAAQAYKIKNVYIHAFLDGRDTPPQSAALYLSRLESWIQVHKIGHIASLHGRFYAMDRDNNWERTQRCYDVLCKNNQHGNKEQSWESALEDSYAAGITDEFIHPTLLDPHGCIKKGDGAIFFNFRPDRARQLTQAFIDPDFNYFPSQLTSTSGTLRFFITPTLFQASFKQFKNGVFFDCLTIPDTLLDVFARQNPPIKTFIIAETEKYAHVTYFFSGMIDRQLPSETRILIPSLKAKNYKEHPEMSAPAITSTLLGALRQSHSHFYLVNYANADMVGHSGDLDATIQACEVLDQQLFCLYQEVVVQQSGTLFVTADHGNAEEKANKYQTVLTSHTTSPVPFVMATSYELTQSSDYPEKPVYGLANVASTILSSMDLKIPHVMEQKTIF